MPGPRGVPAPQNTSAGPALMPTCRNCGQTDAFVVSLTITSTLTGTRHTNSGSRVDGAPSLTLDLQCGHCDSTNVDGDPLDAFRPMLSESEP